MSHHLSITFCEIVNAPDLRNSSLLRTFTFSIDFSTTEVELPDGSFRQECLITRFYLTQPLTELIPRTFARSTFWIDSDLRLIRSIFGPYPAFTPPYQ